MNVPFDFPIKFNERTVYVRSVRVDDLPADIREHITDETQIYAIHSEDGERLALARDRNVAFALARTNEFAPVSVH